MGGDDELNGDGLSISWSPEQPVMPPAHLGELGVEHVPDDSVDVVAERAQPDADLRRRDARSAGHLDGVEKVGHEHSHAVIDHRDRVCGAAEDGVAEEADGADGHVRLRRRDARACPRRRARPAPARPNA